MSAQSSEDSREEPPWLIGGWGLGGVLDQHRTHLGLLEFRAGQSWFHLHPAVLVARAEQGATLLSIGLVFNYDLNSRLRLTAGFLPSYYDRRGGADLGHELEFLSFGEISWQLFEGHRINARIGHISNAGLAEINPGAEIITIGYAIALP